MIDKPATSHRSWLSLACVALLALGPAAGIAQSQQPQQPPAEQPAAPSTARSAQPSAQPSDGEKSITTRALELGSRLLQASSPLGPMDIHLVGFHPMKDDPEHQMEAHHFCHQVNEDFAQCVLFDGDGKGARLNGIEYIISEKLFDGLPQEEKAYWHPHNGEILSGQLVAPGIPAPAEKELMKRKMNSYGKTWHVWNTGTREHPGDPLPTGAPHLAWSFNRDGEIQPPLLQQRDRALDIDSERIRADRADLLELARPQEGVNALHDKFPRPTTPISGVVDRDAAPR